MYEESLKDHNPEDDCSEVDDALDNRFGKPVTEEDIVDVAKIERRCCYQARAIGHNALNQTVKKLCEKVGASGYFTNHSLRRTCASRLYHSGLS